MRRALLLVVSVLALPATAHAQASSPEDAERDRRLTALEAAHPDARLAVLETTMADLKKTTREDTLWIRGLVGALLGVSGYGAMKLHKKTEPPA